jgi:hypothetical protein
LIRCWGGFYAPNLEVGSRSETVKVSRQCGGFGKVGGLADRPKWALVAPSQPQPKLSLSAETPFDAAVAKQDAADMLVDAFFEERLPGDKLEAEAVLDHGKTPTGEIGDAGEPSHDIFAGAEGR